MASRGKSTCTLIIQVWALGAWILLFFDCVVMQAHHAFEPARDGLVLTVGQWIGYVVIASSIFLVEGLGAFQRGFSPMLVRRTRELTAASRWYEIVLGPAFIAGLFAATPRRLFKSWLLMAILIPGLALTVPLLPQPWRAAVDAGVALGLGWGTAVILVLASSAAFRGQWPDVDADFPSSRNISSLPKDDSWPLAVGQEAVAEAAPQPASSA
mmetsp:Transcript_18947/g.34752  ORF Transcript_18947/g.34752 Transcript_18947/m.34752 type:complete len:212 (-) Transcript_18947:116-751(-)